MSVIGSNILAGASGQGGGYNLTKSLRFRSSASAYLNRTPASAGNRRTWTWSGWVKRGILSATSDRQVLFGGYGAGNDTDWFELGWGGSSDGYDKIYCTTNAYNASSTAVYRDPSAWYHIVYVVDTTQATQANRIKVYVNGSQITYDVSSYVPVASQNAQLGVNGAWNHNIAKSPSGSSRYFDGYLTEVNFIDGQALTPSSFGETSTSTGVWIPKKYTGTYGTNGFYLPFTDTTSTSTLGTDFSGNSNTWTVNNISLTSGSTYDSMNDVPTLTSATTANYCVLSPVDIPTSGSPATLSNGNLNAVTPSSGYGFTTGTIAVSSGKWYWEYVATAGSPNLSLGFGLTTCARTYGGDTGSYIYYTDGKTYANAGAGVTYGSTWTTNDVIAVALDLDAGTATFYKNNVSQGTAFTGLSGTFFPIFSDQSPSVSNTFTVNFGQRPFAYTPPTGFVALNTFNLPTPTIGATASTTANKYMDATLYTGTGASLTVTNSGSMQPDFVWFKNRSNAQNHHEMDSVRGGGTILYPNLTNSEDALGTSWANFTSTGFSIGAGSGINNSGQTFVAWQWRANGTPAVTNTAGSITSTVSANTTAGFSIVTYTGTGSNATVGHGLGAAPAMFIVKRRNAGTNNWLVYHQSIGGTGALYLNTTEATQTFSDIWNNTAPTSTVFSIGTTNNANQNTGTYVAYCFAQVAGYSAFGSYTGNGSTDGTFIYTGFRPRFVIIKSSTFAGTDWVMYDSARNTYNALTSELNPNTSGSENNFSGAARMDFVSNGIKIRTSGAGLNNSGSTYIYMAFAENPFKYANAR